MSSRGAIVPVVRPATPDDAALLFATYASTRAAELSLVPWSEAQKLAFVTQQFEAQDRAYRAAYPDGRFGVIELDGIGIGRLYLGTLPDGEIVVIDIALVPEHRGRGIGTALMREVLAEADAAGVVVSLHADTGSAAQRWYEQLGFEVVERGDVYTALRRHPQPVASTDQVS